MVKAYVISIILISCSCASIVQSMYGIQGEAISDSNYQAFQQRFNSNWEWVELDSLQFVEHFKRQKPERTKDCYQPIQLFQFYEGQLKAFTANCYAKGGITRLNWNFDGKFDTFPIQSSISPSEFSVQTIQKGFEIGEDSVIFIYWTSMLENQVNNLLEIIQTYQNKHQVQRVVLLNTDAYFF